MMAANHIYRGLNNSGVSLAVIVVILVTIPRASGFADARCRFASTSASQGRCIFPCRCTNGCNSATGDCINGGQCIDDHPTGYRRNGPACQIGNIAYHKKATQESYMWGDQFPAGRAVDGNVDQWRSHEQCALPGRGQGSNAWWQVDLGGVFKIFRVEIYSGNNRHFGAQCQFKCHCRSGETCDDITGVCPSDCPPDGWGVGCMLKNDNYYNDERGNNYMGKKMYTTHTFYVNPTRRKCQQWTNQNRKKDDMFPDGSRAAAKNYCRNPDNDRYAWCYFNSNLNWGSCILDNVSCVVGRFDVNCVMECHCSNAKEDCQSRKGGCQNGCAPHFSGPTCQECADGYFGELCDRTCHCSSGVCDNKTGHCPSGCSDGWTGDSCQTDIHGRIAFTLSVGNNPDRTSHKQCAVHRGDVANGAVVNKSCTAISRYVSFQRNEGGGHRLTALCEVVVIGHPHISCEHCSTICNNIFGCEACAPGKQQPDCTQDCVKGYYGVNCKESCGKCKNSSQCSIIDGVCGGGCETWYASSMCNIYIDKPNFKLTDIPVVTDITGSSVTVTCPKARNITSDLRGDYYVYIVRIEAKGEANEITRHRAHHSDKNQIEFHITGLRFNTNYTVRVQPYREHNGEKDGGTATKITRFKTKCGAPGIPVIKQAFRSPPDSTGSVTLCVIYKLPYESVCDDIASMRVWYKRQDIATSIWSYTEVHEFTSSVATLSVATYGTYEIKVTVTNNENISVTSNIVTNICTATTPLPSSPEGILPGSKVAVTPGKCLGAGAVAGIAVGVLLLGMVTMAVVMTSIQKMRESSSNAANQQQNMEMMSSLKVADRTLIAQHLTLTPEVDHPAVVTAELVQTATPETTYQGFYQTVPEVNRNGDEYDIIRPAKGAQGDLNEASYANIRQYENK